MSATDPFPVPYCCGTAGVAPAGAGAGGRAEPGLSTDADRLPAGDSGEAEDRVGRHQVPSARDQQPADRPAGEAWRLGSQDESTLAHFFPALASFFLSP